MKNLYKAIKAFEKVLSMDPNNNEIKEELNKVREMSRENKDINMNEIFDVFNDIMFQLGNSDEVIKEKDVLLKISREHKITLNNSILYGKDLTKKVSKELYTYYKSKLWNINTIFSGRRLKMNNIRIIKYRLIN